MLDDFILKKEDFLMVGNNLSRPESVIATQDGSIWACDARGGVVRITSQEEQYIGFQKNEEHGYKLDSSNDLPNGLCFLDDSNLLVANFGSNCLEKLNLNGKRTKILTQLGNQPLGKVNHVTKSKSGRIYLSVSTTLEKWIDAINPNTPDGYIVVLENERARLFAHKLKFPNEIRLDKNEKYLYLAETCGQCIRRFQLDDDGNPISNEIFKFIPRGLPRFIEGKV